MVHLLRVDKSRMTILRAPTATLKKDQFMIKIEPSSDCFTLFFKNRPILKVSTRQPFIEMGTDTAGGSHASRENEPENSKNRTSSCHNFHLIE